MWDAFWRFAEVDVLVGALAMGIVMLAFKFWPQWFTVYDDNDSIK